jgi:DNA-binding NarL/FixJ family response regulator
MFDFSVLIGRAPETSVPAGLASVLAQNPGIRSSHVLSEWAKLLASVERVRPDLVVVDRALWRAASGRRLQRISVHDPVPRIVMYSDEMDASVVGEAIAYGVQGCLAADASESQWINAMQVVLRGDIAMPRNLLATALERTMHRRVDDPAWPQPRAAERSGEPLTERERDVIRCVTSGMSNKEIAKHLGISGATVKTHLHHVFGKLKVGRRMLLVPGSARAS